MSFRLESKKSVAFTVQQDGQECDLIHVFRPAKPGEWLAYQRAFLAMQPRVDDAVMDEEDLTRVAEAKLELWNATVLEVQGYSFEGRPLELAVEPQRDLVPIEHRLLAVNGLMEKKSSEAIPVSPKPSRPSSARSRKSNVRE